VKNKYGRRKEEEEIGRKNNCFGDFYRGTVVVGNFGPGGE